MSKSTSETRKAIAIDQFGGIEKMKVQTLTIPEIRSDEILVRVESAGVGVWDPLELEGFFARITNQKPSFPYILGSDGAGTVVAVGEDVSKFKEGDRIYGFSSFDGRTGFYSEYAVVKAEAASLLPKGLSLESAGAMPVDAMTALRGLDDSLQLKSGESVMIFGASGGIGHLAIQLAKRMGARVFAVASGADGVAFAKRLGADIVVDGRKDDVVAAAQDFAPDGLDAVLLTAGGDIAEKALTAVKKGGRVAYPHGVELKGAVRSDIKVTDYDGWPDPEAINKLNGLIQSGQFEVHVAHAYPLEQATEAHKALKTHYLGKLALKVQQGRG
jgi:NADPH:quinone reductase-like Zn-dependent oxidoreductase